MSLQCDERKKVIVPRPVKATDNAVLKQDMIEKMYLALFQNDYMELTVNGLQFKSEKVPFEEWEAAGRMLYMFDRCRSFAVGDWVNYGEAAYGEKYTQALDMEMYKFGTLRNMAWVAKAIPLARRRLRLSFKHHIMIAALSVHDQDRFLDLAVKNEWNTNKLWDAVEEFTQKDKKKVKRLETRKQNMLNALCAKWMPFWTEYSKNLDEDMVDELMPFVAEIWEAAVNETSQRFAQKDAV